MAVKINLAEMKIGAIIQMKGTRAGELMDEVLCECEGKCCPKTSLTLTYAARLTGNESKLPELIKKLKELEGAF
jgi:hypothetical protein